MERSRNRSVSIFPGMFLANVPRTGLFRSRSIKRERKEREKEEREAHVERRIRRSTSSRVREVSRSNPPTPRLKIQMAH